MDCRCKDYFVIIDGNSIVHRAFHALPPLKREGGQVVNAVYGFLLILFKIMKEFEPRYIVACFDRPEPTIRKQKFQEYKAKRVKAPQELYDQIPLVKEVLEAFHIPVFEKPGYEGDDLIGTISRLSIEENPLIRNIIVSGDNDVFQLVNDRSEIYYLKKGVKDTALCGKDFVFEKFGGLTPLQIIDYKALRGDQSDNIPGVVGIGEKTAIDLVLRFGGLGGIYDAIERGDKGIKDGVRDKLLNNKENAFLSLDLAKIITDAPIEMGDVSACEWRDYDKKKMIDILFSFGFKSLIPKLPGGIIEEDINVIEREPEVGGNLKLW